MSTGQADYPEVGVCLVYQLFYPLYGGPPVRFQRYAPGLMQRGIQMRVFTQAVTPELINSAGLVIHDGNLQAEPQSQASGEWPLFEVIDGIPVQRNKLPGGWLLDPTYLSRLIRYCSDLRSKIDVVQFSGLDIWTLPWIKRLRRLGVRAVISQTLLSEFSSSPWRRILQTYNRRFSLNLADGIVVSSSVMQRELEGYGVSSPIQVIPNGVDLQRFRPIESEEHKASLRRKLGLDPADKLILAVGPITPRKGTDLLVEAFVRLGPDYPSARLVLVGPRQDLGKEGPDPFGQRIQKTIAEANARDRVIFTGGVSNVEDYLRAADLLVFPSLREGMPNVMPEAMACGLPVIATPFLGLPEEFGTPGVHYVLSNWEIDNLAGDIRRFLEDSESRKTLGREARRWVEQKLDVTHSLDQYAAFYREVVAHSPQKGLKIS